MIDNNLLEAIVEVGSFHMDYDPSCNIVSGSSWSGTNVIFGSGVSDIDHILRLMAAYPNGLFKLDVGAGISKDSSWLEATSADMTQLRALFVARWGETNKPTIWLDEWDTPTTVTGHATTA